MRLADRVRSRSSEGGGPAAPPPHLLGQPRPRAPLFMTHGRSSTCGMHRPAVPPRHGDRPRPRGGTPPHRPARPPLPRSGRAVDRPDRPAPRPLTRHRQGVLLRPHGREGQSDQGALCGRLPGLRRPHPAAQRQGRRLRPLQGCHPGAIAPQWTRERVREAMRAWRDRYGEPPSSYDWSRTHARRRGGQALERLAEGDWPSLATVTDLHETWAAARADAFESGPSPPQSRRVLRSAERRPHGSRAGMRPPRERS
jgi:hypothetical protein